MRPTAEQLEAARHRLLPDVIAPDLAVLFVGINPGTYSTARGHHFARPGNRFWPTLALAGLTPRLYTPDEDHALLALGLGLTNVVGRTTARAAELEPDELREGARLLARKIERYGPRKVALLGVTAYRVAFERPRAKLGVQSERCGGCAGGGAPQSIGTQRASPAARAWQAFSRAARLGDASPLAPLLVRGPRMRAGQTRACQSMARAREDHSPPWRRGRIWQYGRGR